MPVLKRTLVPSPIKKPLSRSCAPTTPSSSCKDAGYVAVTVHDEEAGSSGVSPPSCITDASMQKKDTVAAAGTIHSEFNGALPILDKSASSTPDQVAEPAPLPGDNVGGHAEKSCVPILNEMSTATHTAQVDWLEEWTCYSDFTSPRLMPNVSTHRLSRFWKEASRLPRARCFRLACQIAFVSFIPLVRVEWPGLSPD